MKKTICVTGGCGYIGSHIVRQLSEADYEVIVIDNLSTGFADSLLHGEKLYECDIADKKSLDKIFSTHKVHAVIHMAASVVVPESVADPLLYYRNNTASTISLLETFKKFQIPNLIFSSTAAVYGEGDKDRDPLKPLNERIRPAPKNPYGHSKLMDEQIIKDSANAYDFHFAILRYFNVAGADPKLRIGQKTKGATHLVKVATEHATGKRDFLSVYGTDYETPDGTGVRDYIHVEDLARAHINALDYIEKAEAREIFNCGYSKGHSVREVLNTLEEVSGKKLSIKYEKRRPGDVSCLIADATKLREKTAWKPQFDNLRNIVEDAYRWEKKLKS